MGRIGALLRNSRAAPMGAEPSSGTIHLILKSRKVARSSRVEVPQLSVGDIHGRMYTISKYVTVWDYEFEEDQLNLLKEARQLSERTGMRLELVDLTRQGPLRRIATRFGWIGAGAATLRPAPGVVVRPAVKTELLGRW
jgi:hypothetical protein